MDTSKTLRMLAATAVVSAMAILLTSPAQAYVPNEDVGPVTRTIVGDPSGTGWVALELPVGTGILLLAQSHRRVASP